MFILAHIMVWLRKMCSVRQVKKRNIIMSKNKVHAFCHSQNITEIQSSAQTSYKGPNKGLRGLVHITHKEDEANIVMPSLIGIFLFFIMHNYQNPSQHHTTLPVNPTVPYKKFKSRLLHFFELSTYWNPRNGFCLRACSGMSFCIISSVAPFNSESIKKQHPLWE